MGRQKPHVYWYVSQQKLAMLSRGESVWRRFSGKVNAGVGLATAEAAIGPAPPPTMARQIAKLEKHLRDEGDVVTVQDIVGGSRNRFFEFKGPSSRTIDSGAFLVAVHQRHTAVFLVGSASNAVAAPGHTGVPLGAVGTFDPLAGIRLLWERYGNRDEPVLWTPDIPSYPERARKRDLVQEATVAWAGLMSLSGWSGRDDFLAPMPTDHASWMRYQERLRGPRPAVPDTEGIALLTMMIPLEGAVFDDFGSVDAMVIGSPIWVEQV
jgi:hypothetical protein